VKQPLLPLTSMSYCLVLCSYYDSPILRSSSEQTMEKRLTQPLGVYYTVQVHPSKHNAMSITQGLGVSHHSGAKRVASLWC